MWVWSHCGFVGVGVYTHIETKVNYSTEHSVPQTALHTHTHTPAAHTKMPAVPKSPPSPLSVGKQTHNSIWKGSPVDTHTVNTRWVVRLTKITNLTDQSNVCNTAPSLGTANVSGQFAYFTLMGQAT